VSEEEGEIETVRDRAVLYTELWRKNFSIHMAPTLSPNNCGT
jgi:hypothetical protein